MAKRRGRGERPVPNPTSMLQQVQKMQADMLAAQEALGDETIEVTAGGGAITIVMTGHQEVREVRINPDVIDTDDEEWLTDLQDLIVAAVNLAIERSKEMAARRMEEIAGPLAGMMGGDLGGLGGLLG